MKATFRTRWTGPTCPQNETHGVLLDWPGSTTAFYCPHIGHVGPRFYTTDLAPVRASRWAGDATPVSPDRDASLAQQAARAPSTAGQP